MALPARPNGSPTPAGFPRSSSIARSLVKLVLLLSAQLPLLRASPISRASSPIFHTFEEDAPKDSQDPTLWVYLSVALALVLLGGAFAGLTIALMGQVSELLEPHTKSAKGSGLRMKYTCKSSKRQAKRMRRNTPPKCLDYWGRASIGCW